MKNSKFSLLARIQSLQYAFNGLIILIKEEHNARVHLFATICVVILGVFFNISVYEWCLIIIAIGFVISLEAVNSAIENIADFICPQQHEMIKKIKDLSAGAVLVGAMTAFIIGLIIFLPKIVELCSKI